MSKVQVKVLYQEQYDKGPFIFDGKLNDVIISLLSIKEMVPAQFQDAADCLISSTSSCGDSYYAEIEVSYTRDQSEEEIKAELARKIMREEQRRNDDLKFLAALKEKYGQ